MKQRQKNILVSLDTWSEVPVVLHDRLHPWQQSPQLIAYLESGKPGRPFPGKRWAFWETDKDILAYLVEHLGAEIVIALKAYKGKRMSFADAARACGRTVNSLKGFAGMAMRLAQKFCREVSQPCERPTWDNPFLAYYGAD